MLESKLEGNLDEVARNYLNKINHSSSRMNRLIRDVLSYSELVKINESYAQVDLNKVVESILTDYELLIEQKEASVNFRGLPTIEAIPLQMSQLFGNLMGNALKFARKDIKPVIHITAKMLTKEELRSHSLPEDLDYCKIKFADNGIGFNEAHGQQIFNIFQRLHRKSEYDGTGIGLAVCKKIAQNHNGEINAIGSSEKGAVFNVILPLRHLKRSAEDAPDG